ncbi:hypothetical protein [Heyndrickxia acidicola]|uniref:Uncharacterized protein n=1 Tax=Heyndrickxia acidicola TaxID=209389 RepID=A0ABU6MS52_9BACI|nr:hypothetical protein [Heyndrickxia acidicola]MED1205860.1 hypothetical protein [Heyndrickxia acidicola]
MVKCLYCARKEGTYPVKKWNKDEILYFCEDHYKEAAKYEHDNKMQFYNHYSNEVARKTLPEESLQKWNKIHEEIKNSPSH